MRYTLVAIIGLLAAGGCGQGTEPAGELRDASDLLLVRVEGESLSIESNSAEPVYFAVVNPEALLILGPCTDPRTCASVRAGKPASVRLADMLGHQPDGHTGVVYHWRLLTQPDGGYAPDRIRELRFQY